MSNFFEIQEFPFSAVTDSVKTEANALNLIKHSNVNLKDYVYIGLPIANIINKLGLSKAQFILNKLEDKIVQKKIYVCQHIFANKLDFKENIVFTPHAEEHDNYKIFPHYNLYFEKKDLIKFEDRKCLFSFFGAFNSHPTRPLLALLNTYNTPVVDTGKWHFEKDKHEQEKNMLLYKKLLCHSKFSLCPRGTGANTIRFYESLSVGSIPIIFNDIKVPQAIKDCIIKFDINNISNLPKYLESVNNAGEMCKTIYNFYWNNLNNDIVHKLIEANV
jgi:hypothetical protein